VNFSIRLRRWVRTVNTLMLSNSAISRFDRPRELEIMSLVARGLSNREIAELLSISVFTVRTHRRNLMEKFTLRNTAEITAYAVRQGYYDPA